MFIALDENKNRISIENATKQNRYFCPICGEPFTIRAENSLAVRKHFAHKRGTNCIDDWSHDMSEWHLSWQEKFPENCREVIVEKDGIKHRADVLINNIVIEFQHSPITSEEITKRNMFYLSCGYPVVWVFDAEGQIKNSVGGFLDPMQCGETDLCWKNPKEQFVTPFPQGVTVFLDYSTEISVPQFSNQKVRIMLLLRGIGTQQILFYKTNPIYIVQANFLKQYGAISDTAVPSIVDIINRTQKLQQPIHQQRVIIYSKIPNEIRKMLSNTQSRPRPRRL